MQSLTPASKMGFSGAYQCHVLTAGCRVGQALFGVVDPGKDRHKFSLVPARAAGSLILLRGDGLFKATEIMCGFEFKSLRHILHSVLLKGVTQCIEQTSLPL